MAQKAARSSQAGPQEEAAMAGIAELMEMPQSESKAGDGQIAHEGRNGKAQCKHGISAEIQGERPAGNSSPHQCSHRCSRECTAEFSSPVGAADARKQLLAADAEHCPSWLMEQASPSQRSGHSALPRATTVMPMQLPTGIN